MLISRYIFRQTASALIMILVSLTLIVWLTSLLREIKLLTAQGQTFLLFLQITALAIPSLIVTVAPVAFLIAALHSLNRLSGDSELIVLSAAGSSVWRLLSPYLFLAVVVSMCVLTANLFVLPKAARLLGDTVSQVRADVLSQVIQPGEFSDLEPGLTFHMRAKGDNGELLGVVVRDERDPKSVTTVIAEQGQILQDGGRASMTLQEGQIIRQQAGKTAAQVVDFTSYAFDIGDFSAKKGPRERKPRERDIGELLYPDKESAAYTKNKGSFRSEIHERFSGALYPIAFAIIAVLYLGRPKTTREGRTGYLFTAFTLGAAIRIAGIAGVNIVGKKAWALGLIYGIPVTVIVAGLVMLRLDIGAPVISLPSLRLPSFLKRGGSAPAARAS
ncbi:LPS export ABC transporter permease LptF [Rhodomicrobium vannielii ATCC 17100]|uniref:LPS export ABC transporter permease LptF n=1 Tax=Rhodomicrobium vannielii TaxID=1069 RepID=UPI001918DC4A|nr:LPS export ABC transporter permease LptF [Rhodomicrobium vannielii]MBJ7535330.1 LPS export ABC transporter permease LptF [Rhodomicrobium vannielii ATCC 17100]